MKFPQLLQTEARRQRLEAVRAVRAKSRAKARAAETDQERQKRLDAARAYAALSRAAETDEVSQKRLDVTNTSNCRSVSVRQKRLDVTNTPNCRSRADETAEKRQKRLHAARAKASQRAASTAELVININTIDSKLSLTQGLNLYLLLFLLFFFFDGHIS